MQIEFLGSGGAFTTPMPGRMDLISQQARAQGLPYSRTGPGVFIHDVGLLVDTCEEVKFQLNRAGISVVPHILYSHWHPDHTAGRRVVEALNWDALGIQQHRQSRFYLPQQVALDFQDRGIWRDLLYYQEVGIADFQVLQDGDTLSLGDIQIRPFRVAEDYVYAFLLQQGTKRVLLAMDELFGWQPPDFVRGVDLAILPMGVPEFHPLTGERLLPADHPVWTHEASHRQTLEMLRQIQPQRAILSHIEGLFPISYQDFQAYEQQLAADGLPLSFAYDTLKVEV